MRRTFPEIALAAALLVCAGARAEEVIYGPDGAPTVVQRKLYPMSSKWEVQLFFDTSLNNALIDQQGGLLAVTYHPNEWLDLGVEGIFNRTVLSGLAQNVRDNLCAPPFTNCRSHTPPKDEFANDNQMRAGGFGVVRLAPIYGKFDLASELKIHFQSFLLGGGGVASVHRESVNLCADTGTDQCKNFQQSDATKPMGLVGAGFRFYVNQRWSLTTEVRGYLFSSSYKASNDLVDPSTGTPTSYLALIATFDAGVSILF
jgi:outer membrane beta-barrel protein